jgi:uncharacterized protein (TIGR03437 family)
MISIFGANFCPNCTTSGTGSILTGSPDTVSLTYPTSLPFDSTHSLWVTFQPNSGGTSFTPANAPILFATNTQINLTVPSVVPTGAVDVVVNYGSLTGSPAPAVSPVYTVNIAATDPGIFTIGADGQGSAAILDMNYNLVSSTNPAGIRTGSGLSDTLSIYVTGLGAPTSTADNGSAGSDGPGGNGLQWSSDCVSPATYLTSFNSAQTGNAISTLDGTLIIPSVLNTGRLIPCILSTDNTTLSIGGQTLTPAYVGWVPGTIAGLYQINVKLPDNTGSIFTTLAGLTNQPLLAPVQLPVTVTAGGQTSQAGVSIWVAPSLAMTGPDSLVLNSVRYANTVSATVGVPLPSSHNSVTVVGGQGTGTVTYTVTSGLLPSGLLLNATTGLISGTPAANTSGSYTVTVTATDSAPIPVTGSKTFVVTVAGGLFMTNTVPGLSTFGTGNAGVSTVSASGGVYPYVYSVAISGFSLPAGLAIDPATGIVTTSALTPAGSYALVVSAHDSTSGSQLLGSANITIVVKLHEVLAATATTFHAGVTSGAANTMVTTGNTGSVTYSLDAGTQALVDGGQLTFDTSTGIVTVVGATSAISSRTVTITATDGAAPANTSAAGTSSASFTLAIVS